MNVCLLASFGGFTVLSVQLFNKIKLKKNMKNRFCYIFRMLRRKTFIFGEFIFWGMF